MTALISFIVWVFFYPSTTPEINGEGYTIGVITHFEAAGKTSGRDAILEYFVDGVKYETSTGKTAYSANVIGERFEIKYDKEKPSNSIVLIHKPVFLNTEEIQSVKGEITRLYRFAWGGSAMSASHAIEFEYEINGVKYKKSQSLPPDFKEKYPYLKKGRSYQVSYWTSNPKRAIIYTNKPV